MICGTFYKDSQSLKIKPLNNTNFPFDDDFQEQIVDVSQILSTTRKYINVTLKSKCGSWI